MTENMDSWNIYRIEDLFEVKNGASIQSRDFADEKKDASYMEVLKIGHIAVGGGLRTEPKKDYVKKTTKLEKFILHKGDIVMAMTDMKDNVTILGVPAMVDEDNKYILNQRVGWLRKRKSIEFDDKFVYYQMRTRRYLLPLQKQANRGVQVNLTTDHIKNSIVYLPSLPEQKRISTFLSELEDKINNNNKICKILESQALAVFKDWFVDFSLFSKGTFETTEYGIVPSCLKYTSISEIPHTLETGKRPAGGVKLITKGVPSIGAENIKGLGCYDYSKTKYIPEDYASNLKRGKINGYELLIYKDGGKPGYFIPNFSIFGSGYPYDLMYLNEHVFKLDFDNPSYNFFAYCFFKSKPIMAYLNAQGAKAAIPGINSKDIEGIFIPTPENKTVQAFCECFEKTVEQILTRSKQSARLANLRDSLLPAIMAGKVSVI